MDLKSNHIVTESDLIKGCIEKKRQMQKILYDRYAPKMYSLCMRYCKNADDAEDMLQEGFIKIFKHIEKFRSDGSFEGWMRRIFVNTTIANFRKSAFINQAVGEDENYIEDGTADAFDNFSEKDIINMIQELSPGYRQIFNMFVIEGYSHKEISNILGIGEGTSKSQLARAKSILRSMIDARTQ